MRCVHRSVQDLSVGEFAIDISSLLMTWQTLSSFGMGFTHEPLPQSIVPTWGAKEVQTDGSFGLVPPSAVWGTYSIFTSNLYWRLPTHLKSLGDLDRQIVRFRASVRGLWVTYSLSRRRRCSSSLTCGIMTLSLTLMFPSENSTKLIKFSIQKYIFHPRWYLLVLPMRNFTAKLQDEVHLACHMKVSME